LVSSPVSYFVRAGALYCHIETENNDGDIISDTGHGVGYQVAGGIEVSLGKNWSLAPGLKFNSLSEKPNLKARITSSTTVMWLPGLVLLKDFKPAVLSREEFIHSSRFSFFEV
jgi:hypothetical protein